MPIEWEGANNVCTQYKVFEMYTFLCCILALCTFYLKSQRIVHSLSRISFNNTLINNSSVCMLSPSYIPLILHKRIATSIVLFAHMLLNNLKELSYHMVWTFSKNNFIVYLLWLSKQWSMPVHKSNKKWNWNIIRTDTKGVWKAYISSLPYWNLLSFFRNLQLITN